MFLLNKCGVLVGCKAFRRLGLAIIAGLFIAFPWLITGYWVRVITSLLMFAALASAMNLMMGYMGYVPFGNAVFFGLGAYATGIMMRHGWNFLSGLFVAIAITGVVCFLFGFPILRLRGGYFAVATIALCSVIETLAVNTTELTGGAFGLSFPLIAAPQNVINKYFYYMMFSLLIAALVINVMILRSRWGFAIRTIRVSEEMAAALGINTTLYKMMTWFVSATVFTIAGSIYGWWMSYISVSDVFMLMISILPIQMCLLGGVGTIIGPIVGAFLFQLISEIAWAKYMEYHLGILGLTIILVLLIMPRGLTVTVKHLLSKAYNHGQQR